MAKKEKDVNVAREWTKLFLGVALAVFGMGIVVVSLIAPPLGAIHYSVVTLFGTVLTYVGFMFGIDSNAKIKMHEQDVEFEIKSKELDRHMDIRMEEFERRYRSKKEEEPQDE